MLGIDTVLMPDLAGPDIIGIAHPSAQLRAGLAKTLQYRPAGWV